VEIQAQPPSQTVSEKLMSATGGSEHQTFVIRLPLSRALPAPHGTKHIRAYDQDDRTFEGKSISTGVELGELAKPNIVKI
jgi:hypothetical protein